MSITFQETLIQNSPFKGQIIDPHKKQPTGINDFVGHFQVITDENELWDHVSVVRHSQDVRSFQVASQNQPILLREYSEKDCGIGAGCWLSSIAMLSYLNNNYISPTSRVLEIGCGVALNALYLASQGHQSITASDCFETIGCAFEENKKLNNTANGQYKLLDWQQCCSDNYDPLDTIGEYDLIIATDCIYRSTAPMFFQTIRKHLSKNGGKLLLINPVETSRAGIDEFIYKLAEMGDVSVQHIAIQFDHKYTKPLLMVVLTTEV
jgi:2-polyprenyl-3-methyl-5-hydroxy-6-metoxy-1,4-benzoquinol methylase